jgi:hypothetical protein
MATENIPAPRAIPEPRQAASRFTWLAGWRDPWWKPAIGIPLYALAASLFIGALLTGTGSVVLQSLELLALALIAADARGCRRHVPVLSSNDKAVAAGGWAILLLALLALAIALPEI